MQPVCAQCSSPRATVAPAFTLQPATRLRRRMGPNYKLNKLLRGNLKLFNPAERSQLHSLAGSNRRYLLQHWPRPGVKDATKRELVALAAAGDAPALEEARLREFNWKEFVCLCPSRLWGCRRQALEKAEVLLRSKRWWETNVHGGRHAFSLPLPSAPHRASLANKFTSALASLPVSPPLSHNSPPSSFASVLLHPSLTHHLPFSHPL